MDIVIEDLPKDELRENAVLVGCKVSELPRLRDVEPYQLAELFLPRDDDAETFAGSDIYCRVAGASLIDFDWVPPAKKGRAALAKGGA